MRNISTVMPDLGMKAGPVIVVEIGNDWLKLVEGRAAVGGGHIGRAHFIKLSDIKGPVFEAVAGIFKENRWDKDNVLLYLPRHLVTVRILELPSLHLQEIDDIISLHIGKQTPYAREEIVYSYKVIGRGKEGCSRVFLAIVRRNLVDVRMDMLAQASIRPRRVALSSEGVWGWFNAFCARRSVPLNSGAVVLIDIDSNYSDFIVIYKGDLRFSKNILIGANQLIDEKGLYSAKFSDEVSHAVDVFNEEAHDVKLAGIFLSGAAKAIGGLEGIVKTRLDLPCETVDPLDDVQLVDQAHLLRAHTRFISLSPVLGMLIKDKELNIDLMPLATRMEQILEKKRQDLAWTGFLLCVIIAAVSILVTVHMRNKDTYFAMLKARVDSMKEASEDVDRMRRVIDLVHERADTSGDALDLLSEIYRLIPQEIFLTDVDLEDKRKIVLKGRAHEISGVYKFVNILSGSPFFEKVRNTYAVSKEENNNTFADFEIVAEYKKTSKR